MEVRTASAAYEEVGEVPFGYIPLHPLHALVPPAAPVLPLPRPAHPMAGALYVEQAPAVVHAALVELADRSEWDPKVKAVQFDATKVNRVGTVHVCLLDTGSLRFRIVAAEAGPGRLAYGEQLLNAGWVRQSSRYYLLDADGADTRVRLEVHYRHWPLGGWLLDRFYRKAVALDVGRHLHRLKAYCERG